MALVKKTVGHVFKKLGKNWVNFDDFWKNLSKNGDFLPVYQFFTHFY